ncbi:archease [Halorubrum vacuolatum]|uniref:archease n=1 Tax=Halorubrum vacuolatum TaxID=63740 RepID=UPI000B76D62B|nr:archease [Halorubrum vacuolatum]
MSYQLREHTADVAVEASAPTLAGVFAAVAEGFTAASCEAVPDGGERFELTVTAESREAALFEYLDELIYERDVRLVLPVDHEVTVDGSDHEVTVDESGHGAAVDESGHRWEITATARGVPLAELDAREIKAVTYSEMTLERRDGGWYAYVVFDV